jgi:hypothetical protein
MHCVLEIGTFNFKIEDGQSVVSNMPYSLYVETERIGGKAVKVSVFGARTKALTNASSC